MLPTSSSVTRKELGALGVCLIMTLLFLLMVCCGYYVCGKFNAKIRKLRQQLEALESRNEALRGVVGALKILRVAKTKWQGTDSDAEFKERRSLLLQLITFTDRVKQEAGMA